MFAALTAFAGVQSEAQILALVQAIVKSLFAAEAAMLLTRGGPAFPAHRISLLAGGASQVVHVARPELEERLQRGAIFASQSPGNDLPGVPVPFGARSALLVPCSSVAATNAVCAFWSAERAFTHAELDRLRALATVAGLAFDRQIAESRARILRADLENRVRNVLAVIRSVGARSAGRAPSLDAFLLHFEGRIDAIGRSQIAAARGGDVSFELLLREELLAQTIQDGADVSLEGLDVAIPSEQAEALGLAMHELAVNAVEFGPFCGSGGSLGVRWWVEGGGGALTLNIDWHERCVRPIARRPARIGFGLTYLERALPFQLNAETRVEFGSAGLRCRIGVPLARRPGRPTAEARARAPVAVSGRDARPTLAAEAGAADAFGAGV